MNNYAQNNALDSFKQSYVKLPTHLQIKPSHGPYTRFKQYSSEGFSIRVVSSGMLAGIVIFLPALCVILFMTY